MSDGAVVSSDRYSERADQFSTIVRELRRRESCTLAELGERSGLSPSTISKIENGQLSPSYETLLRLADGLRVDISALFNSDPGLPTASGRRTVTRNGQGTAYRSGQYAYEMLCSDLSRKQFFPLRTKILARSLSEFDHLPHHEGEEFFFVLSGAVELYTDHYEPMRLDVGDSSYFDSTMGHALISLSDEPAEILWITSRIAERNATPAAVPAKTPRKGRSGKSS